VKHGYVTFARDWPFSTFHRLVQTGLYPADWAAGDIDDLSAGEASTALR
jgi:putative transposase